MSAETEKVLSRVKKLLALAACSAASEGERDNALRMAHATLSKHNLSMSAVEELGDTGNNDPRKRSDLDLESDAYWARIAIAGVGRLFFCMYFYDSGLKRHAIVGKSVNVATATYLSEYVVASIKREATNAAKHYHGDCKLNALLDGDGPTMPEASKPAWTAAFCAAAAQTVSKRCKEMAAAAAAQRAEGSPGTSLVLASYYKRELEANADFIKRVLGIHLQSSRRTDGRDIGSARDAGAAFGGKINLSQQVGNSSATLRLK